MSDGIFTLGTGFFLGLGYYMLIFTSNSLGGLASLLFGGICYVCYLIEKERTHKSEKASEVKK